MNTEQTVSVDARTGLFILQQWPNYINLLMSPCIQAARHALKVFMNIYVVSHFDFKVPATCNHT